MKLSVQISLLLHPFHGQSGESMGCLLWSAQPCRPDVHVTKTFRLCWQYRSGLWSHAETRDHWLAKQCILPLWRTCCWLLLPWCNELLACLEARNQYTEVFLISAEVLGLSCCWVLGSAGSGSWTISVSMRGSSHHFPMLCRISGNLVEALDQLQWCLKF